MEGVIGALGTQITMDLGATTAYAWGMSLKLCARFESVKHPLLKEIVDWETNVLACGKNRKCYKRSG